MILWGRPSSVNVQKVLWALTECGLPYAHRVVGGKYGGTDDPEFTALTPMRRVPVLQDGDLALWESHTILRHLARKTGQFDQPEGLVDMWMEFGSTTLQPPFIGLFWQRVRMRPAERDAKAEAAYMAALADALCVLDAGLGDQRGFVAGGAVSMADIALGSLFYRLLDIWPDSLEATPHVSAWVSRISQRRGYRDWVATSYDELRVSP